MGRDSGWRDRCAQALTAPVSPLRGVALLVAVALAGTLLLERAARPVAPPQVPRVTGDPVVVHVTGHVTRPGLYWLTAGDRVADAITAAGGATTEADLHALNLARVLEDGEQLFVAGPQPQGGAAPGARPDGRIDLNRATAAQLDALPGIGPVLAARIVAYRDEHGGFRSVSDLRRVQGIGDKLYRALEELVAV